MVGCADYTDFYPSLLGKYGNEVYLRKYYPKEFFDVVLFGGVFGYGLNKIKDAEKAMKALHVVLKKKGKLVIWWADQKGNNSVVPKKLKNFKLFKRIDLISLYSGYRTKSKVVFDILEKQ